MPVGKRGFLQGAGQLRAGAPGTAQKRIASSLQGHGMNRPKKSRTTDIARVGHPEVCPWLEAGSRHRCRELLPSLVDESRAVHCLDGGQGKR